MFCRFVSFLLEFVFSVSIILFCAVTTAYEMTSVWTLNKAVTY